MTRLPFNHPVEFLQTSLSGREAHTSGRNQENWHIHLSIISPAHSDV